MNLPTAMRGSPKLATAVLHGAPFLLSMIAVAPIDGRFPGLPELALGIGSFLALTAAGLVLERRQVRGRWLARIGLTLATAGLLLRFGWNPALFLAAGGGLLLAAAAVESAVSRAWRAPSRGAPRPRPLDSARDRLLVCGLLAGPAWFGVVVGRLAFGFHGFLAVGIGLALTGVFLADWLAWRTGRPGLRLLAVFPMAVAGAGVRLAPSAAGLALLAVAGVLPLAALLIAARTRGLSPRSGEILDFVIYHPARLLAATFAVLCAAGALLLALPLSSATSTPLSFVDAAFTAVSAVCVTGLTVRDTAGDLSRFGQIVVLGLIQIGGIGIMSLSAAALAAAGKRLGLRAEGVVVDLLSGADRRTLAGSLRQLLAITFAAEAVGAVLLFVAFAGEGDALPQAAWRGSFTAISAFCNAGFALQSASLVPYAGNQGVLHVVALLVVAGGLSPAVVWALPRVAARRHVSLHVKVALATTAILLAAGTLLFAAVEWRGSLSPLGLADRLGNAFFQSVTLRTAGFNSVGMEALHPVTITWMMVFMVVGGCPGSTAGGIKTTTMAVLVLATLAAIRGRDAPRIFGRRLTRVAVSKALAVAMVSLGVLLAAFVALIATQDLPGRVALFEVVSALGTVGLSLGGTAALDAVGKIVIMCCMFIGRIGPLTIFLLLEQRRGEDERWTLPEERIDVG
jgi:trk system potassium uptake protein TrkH